MGKHVKLKEHKNGFLILIIMLTAILVICGITYIIKKISTEKNDYESEVINVINSTFSSLQELDIEEVNKYMAYENLVNSIDETILKYDDKECTLQKELFKQLTWSIENIEIEENKAIVIVEATNKNFKTIFTEWMEEISNIKASTINMTENEAMDTLVDVLKQKEEKKTVIKKVILNTKNGVWKIKVDEDLRNLIFPGIDSVVKAFNN